MGNLTSCCTYTTPLARRKDAGNGAVHEFPQEGEESVGNLQHISEREQDDWNTDPSVHPKVATIFLERSKVESELSIPCGTSVTFTVHIQFRFFFLHFVGNCHLFDVQAGR